MLSCPYPLKYDVNNKVNLQDLILKCPNGHQCFGVTIIRCMIYMKMIMVCSFKLFDANDISCIIIHEYM